MRGGVSDPSPSREIIHATSGGGEGKKYEGLLTNCRTRAARDSSPTSDNAS